ncbi:MAG: hypothetical protein ACTHKS_12495 [Gaiellaceae bacterium]
MTAALASLLSDALERDENRGLVDDQFRTALRDLVGRVENELEEGSSRNRLRLAGDESASQ